MVLNFHNPFVYPFFLKTFLFGFFANRAIPLLTVNFIKRMSVFAESFLGINVCYRTGILERVFSLGDALKMLWINTRAVTANMINNFPVRNLYIRQIKSDPMRSTQGPFEKKYAVTVLIFSSCPLDAITRFFALGVKSFNFFIGSLHVSSWGVVGTKRYIG